MPNKVGPITELLNAWNIKGSNPNYHDILKKRLKQEWPVLYRAIERIKEDYSG